MKSKIIQVSSTRDFQGIPLLVALCEDGSVWTSEDLNAWNCLEEPFRKKSIDRLTIKIVDSLCSERLIDSEEDIYIKAIDAVTETLIKEEI